MEVLITITVVVNLEVFMKIQLYPSDELAQVLSKLAMEKEVSLNALIIEVLENTFLNKDVRPLSEITEKVFEEVREFVENNPYLEFDLLTASETFRGIPMVKVGKPNPIRSQIGRNFANSVSTGRFGLPIQKVTLENGKNKLSANNSLLYKRI